MPSSGLHGHTLDAQIGIKINAKKMGKGEDPENKLSLVL